MTKEIRELHKRYKKARQQYMDGQCDLLTRYEAQLKSIIADLSSMKDLDGAPRSTLRSGYLLDAMLDTKQGSEHNVESLFAWFDETMKRNQKGNR